MTPRNRTEQSKPTELAEMNRLRWKCRRGMLELDLMLKAFLDSGYGQLDSEAKSRFEKLLVLEDDVLFPLLMGHTPPFDKADAALLEVIRAQSVRST